MAKVYSRIGSAVNVFGYDDGDYSSAIETTAPIKAGAPVASNDVLRYGDLTIFNLATVYKTNFTAGDLIAGVLTVSHNLDKDLVFVQVRDNNDETVSPDKIEKSNDNIELITLLSSMPLIGTWKVIIIG